MDASVSENNNTKQTLTKKLQDAETKLQAALDTAKKMKGNYEEIEAKLQAKMKEIDGNSELEIQQIQSKFQTELAELQRTNAGLQQQYTQQKDAANETISQLKEKIGSLKPQIQTLEGDGGGAIAKLQQQIIKNGEQLTEMNTELEGLKTTIQNIPNVNEDNNIETLKKSQTENTTKKDEKIQLKKLLEDKSKAINDAIDKLKNHLNAILNCVFTDGSVNMENLAGSANLSEYCEKIEAYFRGDKKCEDVTVLEYNDITTAYLNAVKDAVNALNENGGSKSEKNKALPVESLQYELNLEYFKELIQLYYFFVCVLKDADKEEIQNLATEAASLDKILGDIQSKLELQQKKTDLNTKISELEEKNRQNQTELDKQKIELSNLQQLLAKAKSELQKAQKEADKAEEDLKKGQEKSEDEEKQLRKQQESNLANINAETERQKAEAVSQADADKLQVDADKLQAEQEAQTTFDNIKNTLDAKIKTLQESIDENTKAIQLAESEKTILQTDVTAKQAYVDLKTNLIPLLNQLNRQLRSMQVEEILIEDVIPKIERKDGENGSGDDDLPAKYAGDILVIKDVLHQVLNGNKSEDKDNNITVTIGDNIFNDTARIADNLKSLFRFESGKKMLKIDDNTIIIKRGSNDKQYDVQYDDGDNPITVLKNRINSAKTEYGRLHTSLGTMNPINENDILEDGVDLDEPNKSVIQGLITQINELFKNNVNVTVNDNNGSADVKQMSDGNDIAQDLYVLRFNAFIDAYINSTNRLCDVITDASKDCGHNFKEKINKQQFLRKVIDTLGIKSSFFEVTRDSKKETEEHTEKIDEFLQSHKGSFNFSVKYAINNIKEDKFSLINIDPNKLVITKPIKIILKPAQRSGAHIGYNSAQIGAKQVILPKDVFTSILDNLKIKE